MASELSQQEQFAIQAARHDCDKCNSTRYHGCAKVVDFHESYVTCITCDACYDQCGNPTYCQKGFPVDPRAIFENQDRARNCGSWFPRAIGRRASGPEYDSGDRWHEKDSMA